MAASMLIIVLMVLPKTKSDKEGEGKIVLHAREGEDVA